MSLERKPSLNTFENPSRDAVSGIEIINPGLLKRSFWRDVLQYRIKNGKLELAFITDPPGKRPELKRLNEFNGLSELKNSPMGVSRKNLRRIVNNIRRAKTVYLMGDGERQTPTKQPPSQTRILSPSELQKLIGDLPKLDEI
ncbi:hypothetical protein HYT32_00575 [Candidatus Roizmanbacteria bacterium]|nr:hypothetical protein [Candidatus Roizmanbacteria bacterium]